MRQLSSKSPASSSGRKTLTAFSAYMLMMRWPARRAVSLTYSLSSARPCTKRQRGYSTSLPLQCFSWNIHWPLTLDQSNPFSNSTVSHNMHLWYKFGNPLAQLYYWEYSASHGMFFDLLTIDLQPMSKIWPRSSMNSVILPQSYTKLL